VLVKILFAFVDADVTNYHNLSDNS